MQSLWKLFMDGGPILFFLLLLFLGALLLMLIQLVLARKIIFPGLFLGLAAAIFALALSSMARDYLMALKTIRTVENLDPLLFFGTNGIALIPIFFALAMVIVLLVLQAGANLLSKRSLLHLHSPTRVSRLIWNFALLGLLVSGFLCTRTMLIANNQFSESSSIADEKILTLSAYLKSSIVIDIVTFILASVIVATSIILTSMKALQTSADTALPSKG